MDIDNLVKPGSFQRQHRKVFRTYSALRYHLDRRHRNGLISSGAVIESPLGLLIEPQNFEQWLVGQVPERSSPIESEAA